MVPILIFSFFVFFFPCFLLIKLAVVDNYKSDVINSEKEQEVAVVAYGSVLYHEDNESGDKPEINKSATF